jgi:hypothetical protein
MITTMFASELQHFKLKKLASIHPWQLPGEMNNDYSAWQLFPNSRDGYGIQSPRRVDVMPYYELY